LYCIWQQDGGADGDGPDEAAAEPAGGAGAPDAPRRRRAPPRPPGEHRTDQSKHSIASDFSVYFLAFVSSSGRFGSLLYSCSAIWMTLQLG
jgi:hypothetical protein